MVIRRSARSWRRAAGRLRPGGKVRRSGDGLRVTDAEEGIAPDETDQCQVAVESWPGAALVVTQPQLLLAVLMEALDRPALVRQAELLGQRAVVHVPGEVPLGLAVLARQGPLADQPAERAGLIATGAVDAQSAGQALGTPLLWVEYGNPGPALGRYLVGQLLAAMQRGDLHGVRVDARAARPTSRRQRLASGAADLGWEADAEDLADLNHVRFLARLQASQKVGDIPIAGIGGHHGMRHAGGPRPIQQLQRQLRLGPEGDLGWHPRGFPSVLIGRPALGQEQAGADRPVAAWEIG